MPDEPSFPFLLFEMISGDALDELRLHIRATYYTGRGDQPPYMEVDSDIPFRLAPGKLIPGDVERARVCKRNNDVKYERVLKAFYDLKERNSKIPNQFSERRMEYLRDVIGRIEKWYAQNRFPLPAIIGYPDRNDRAEMEEIERSEQDIYIEAISALRLSRPRLQDLVKMSNISKATWHRRFHERAWVEYLIKEIRKKYNLAQSEESQRFWADALNFEEEKHAQCNDIMDRRQRDDHYDPDEYTQPPTRVEGPYADLGESYREDQDPQTKFSHRSGHPGRNRPTPETG